MTSTLHPPRTAFPSAAPVEFDLRPALDEAYAALAEETCDSPFAQGWWSAAWMRHFAPGARCAMLIGAREGRIVMAAPFVQSSGWVRRLTALFNPHVPFLEYPLRPEAVDAVAHFLDYAARVADVLMLPCMLDDSPWTAALQSAAEDRRLRLHRWTQPPHLLLDLPTDWSAARQTVSTNLLQDTQRKRRQLEKMGAVRMVRVPGVVSDPASNGRARGMNGLAAHAPRSNSISEISVPTELTAALEACYALEAASWKGERGSAIRCRPETLGFYNDIARAASARGELGLYQLMLNDRLIAFELGLVRRSVYHLLKLSYDGELARFSPGNVLRLAILEDLCRTAPTTVSNVRYDFGIESDWKLRWTQQRMARSYLAVYFRTPRGALAWSLGPGPRVLAKRSRIGRTLLAAARRLLKRR